jgi:hypothetical protein
MLAECVFRRYGNAGLQGGHYMQNLAELRTGVGKKVEGVKAEG